MQQEAADLFTGSNNATSAFAKTGLFPFNPLSESWENAIDSLGLDSVLNEKREVSTQWEIRVIKVNEGRPVLTMEERNELRDGWEFHDKENEVESIGALQSDLLIAKMRGDGILGRWQEERKKLIDKEKNAKKLHPTYLEISNKGDNIVLKSNLWR